MLFRLLAGLHEQGDPPRLYKANDIVESHIDLVKHFGDEKFRLVGGDSRDSAEDDYAKYCAWLDKLTDEQLTAHAKERGFEVDEGETRASVLAALKERKLE